MLRGGNYMNDELKEVYIVEPLKSVDFTEEELLEMGIIFFDNLEDISEHVKEFGYNDFDEDSQLIDYELTLSQVGPVSSPKWALHSYDLMQEYICDVWNEYNFYSISVREENHDVKIVEKAYLRDETIQEDMLYYVEDRLDRLAFESMSGPTVRH